MAGSDSKVGDADYRPLGVPWREDHEILARIRQVEALRFNGLTYGEIAKELGISIATVWLDFKRSDELAREYTARDVEAIRADFVKDLLKLRDRALEYAGVDLDLEHAVLFDTDAKGAPRPVIRPEKGGVSFRGSKSQALAVARAATMDAAKLLGIVVDKATLTDAKGNDVDLAAILGEARDKVAKDG